MPGWASADKETSGKIARWEGRQGGDRFQQLFHMGAFVWAEYYLNI
jgi:hypothetical protein